MKPTTRSRIARTLGALVGAAALVTALPAQAERRDHRHRDDDRRGWDGGHRHDRDWDHGRAHGRSWDRRDHGRHRVVYAPRFHPTPRYYRGGYRAHAPAYFCGHCRSHFASYDGLYGHVHHHHRVPTWRVPGLLTQVSFGWTF